jgi:hypothetical protein
VLTSLKPIIPAVRRDPFDDPAWLFDLKLDGFRGLADTIAGWMLSKNGNQAAFIGSHFFRQQAIKPLGEIDIFREPAPRFGNQAISFLVT